MKMNRAVLVAVELMAYNMSQVKYVNEYWKNDSTGGTEVAAIFISDTLYSLKEFIESIDKKNLTEDEVKDAILGFIDDMLVYASEYHTGIDEIVERLKRCK